MILVWMSVTDRAYDNLADVGFVPFEKAIVTAPSTIMSAIAMFTGRSAFDRAKTYHDFAWVGFRARDHFSCGSQWL